MSYQIDEYLYILHCELWNISQLVPNEFVQKAIALVGTGTETQLIAMIRQGIHEYKNERAIMKYIYIIDKLLKFPTFLAVFQTSIVELYSDIFISLLIQKCSNQIDELKILRKYWVGIIHPNTLQQIREAVRLKTNLDIDTGFKNQAIVQIKNYYINKLQLSVQELTYHLPQIQRKVEEVKLPPPSYVPENYLINKQMLMASQLYQPLQAVQAVQAVRMQPIQQMQPMQSLQSMQLLQNNQPLQKHLPLQSYPSYQNQNVSMNHNQIRSNEQPEQVDYKRKRHSSQETKPPSPYLYENISPIQQEAPKPRKIVHLNESLLTHKEILANLANMNSFKCKECGLSFGQRQNFQAHKFSHTNQKLMKIDRTGKKSTAKQVLLRKNEWVSTQHKSQESIDKFCISVRSVNQYTLYNCHLCGGSFETLFAQEWVFSNAVKVEIMGNISIMHKSCQQALESSSEEEEE